MVLMFSVWFMDEKKPVLCLAGCTLHLNTCVTYKSLFNRDCYVSVFGKFNRQLKPQLFQLNIMVT